MRFQTWRARGTALSSLMLAAGLAAAIGGCDTTSPGGGGGYWDAQDDACEPKCYLKACGPDGCGGVCGTCEDPLVCQAFQCVDPGSVDVVVPPDATDATEAGDSQPDVKPDPGPVSPEDGDGDGVKDLVDNCPTVPNADQKDMDADFIGDACDPDIDGDDYLNDFDCAPSNPKINPERPERCGNSIDDNCNGLTDEENAGDCTDYFIDDDGDGAGRSDSLRCLCIPDGDHKVKVAGDCDDNDATVSPLQPEVCDDIDNDCNLLVDEGCDDDGDGYCDASMDIVGTPAICPKGGGDCYDYSGLISPEAIEVEADGLDNDCDGVKEGEPQTGPIEQPVCQGTCTGTSQDALICSLELCYGPEVVQGFQVYSPTGDMIAGTYDARTHYGASYNDLVPFAGSSYMLISSGYINSFSHQPGDELPGTTTAVDVNSKDGYDQMNDVVEIKITLKAPEGAKGFSIDYIFMSTEYEEWIDSQFNDKFYMFLKAPQTTGNQKEVINYAACSNPSVYWDFVDAQGTKWCYIAINNAFSEPCLAPQTNIDGTGYECYTGSSTGWLQTSWPINPGEVFELTFHIHDTSDQVWDSLVIIDNFRWEGGAFTKGTASHN